MPFHPYSFGQFEAGIIKRSRTAIEPSPEAIAARTDFIAFREYVCNHPSPKHHRKWASILETGKNSRCLSGIGGDHTLILAPRGSAKSTFTVEWTAFQIGRQTSFEIGIPIKILYVSYSIEVSMLKSEQIQEIVLSPKYQEVFPHIRPGKKWNQKLWDIDKSHADLPLLGEPYTLSCAGMKGALAGKRAHLALFDDLIKSPEQIENPAIRERMENNWLNVIRPILYEGARAVCLGTRMMGTDIYATAFTRERGWNVIEESAIIDDEYGEEQSYWPEVISLQYLQTLRDDDPPSFSMQYQNVIPEEGQGVIHPEWWIEDTPPDLDEFESLIISSDLSSSLKEKADYTVFLLMGKKDNQYWILDMKRGRWSGNIDKCDVLLSMLFDWDILETKSSYEVDHRSGKVTWHTEKPIIQEKGYYLNLFVEGQSYQLSFRADWNNYIQNTLGLFSITCFPVQVKGDKLQRLRGITGVMQKGQVRFNKYRKLKKIRQELIGFGSAAKDDCCDTLVLGLNALGVRNSLDVM